MTPNPYPKSRLPGPSVRLFEYEEANRRKWEAAAKAAAAELARRGMEADTLDLKAGGPEAEEHTAITEVCRNAAPQTLNMSPGKQAELVAECRDPGTAVPVEVADDPAAGVQRKIGDS